MHRPAFGHFEPARPCGGAGLVTVVALLAAGSMASAAPMVRFRPATVYDLAGSGPQDLTLADFDRDADLDLAAACNGNSEDPVGEVGVNLNDGAGGFASDLPFGPSILPWGIAAADFNGDDIPDLAVTDGRAASSAVQIYLGNGVGGFNLHTTLTASAFPVAVVAGRFNADSAIDLAVVGNTGAQLSIFHGSGAGSFTKVQTLSAGGAGLHLRSGDLNGDGRPDLVTAHYNGAQAYLCGPTGLFTAAGSAGGGVLTEAVGLGDVNGDGKLDVAAAELYLDQVRVRLGNGDGTFGTGLTRPAAWPKDVVLADLNKDGMAELLVAAQSAHSVRVYLAEAGGLSATPLDFGAGTQPAALAVGDFNGDGWLDVACALRNFGDTARVSILLQQALGDMDCDGDVDFFDIDPLVVAFSGEAAYLALYPHCQWLNGDIDGNGNVDFFDIDPFIARLGLGG